MDNIRAFIIDDEIGAITTLQRILHLYCPNVEVSGYARSVPEAIRLVGECAPDIVFLDVEMTPAGNGFDFIEQTRSHQFGVIFTTAYPQYAIQAIKSIQPWYYLVKPFSLVDLMEAVKVSSNKIAEAKARKTNDNKEQSISLPTGRKGNAVIKVDQLLYCTADQSVSDVYLLSGGEVEKITVFCSLGLLEKRLANRGFFRIHHSHLVNISKIKSYTKNGRTGTACFAKDHQVSIAVSKMKEFEGLIRLHSQEETTVLSNDQN